MVVVVTPSIIHPLSTVHTFSLDSDRSAQNPLCAGSYNTKLSEVGPATQNSTTDDREADRVRDTWEDHSHTNESINPVNNTVELVNPNASHPNGEDDKHIHVPIRRSELQGEPH